jgi:hypothetical protein
MRERGKREVHGVCAWKQRSNENNESIPVIL